MIDDLQGRLRGSQESSPDRQCNSHSPVGHITERWTPERILCNSPFTLYIGRKIKRFKRWDKVAGSCQNRREREPAGLNFTAEFTPLKERGR
ncbi:MAG: hypothetical protein V3R58_07405, partial [candidate division NC10 bacterium]